MEYFCLYAKYIMLSNKKSNEECEFNQVKILLNFWYDIHPKVII